MIYNIFFIVLKILYSNHRTNPIHFLLHMCINKMTISMKGFTTTTFLLHFSMLCIPTLAALDTLTPNHPLTSNQTLVSTDGNFEVGFFSPENSKNQYLGVWFKKPHPIEVVWVANRHIPLPKNPTGALKLIDHGVLILLSHKNTPIWSSNASRSVKNPILQLLNTGNLVVRDESDHDPENFLWQSFDYPSDTFLPGFKLGLDRAKGLDRFLTSWKSPNDPSPGNYTCGMLSTGYPQLIVSQGSEIKLRIGPWNGLRFSGAPNPRRNPIYKFNFVLNDKEVYYSYDLLESSVLSRTVLGHEGLIQRSMWVDPVKSWILYLAGPTDSCDAYALCGAYGSCNLDNTPLCQCLSGFVPKFPEKWDRVDWSGGCVRRSPLNCSHDVFLKYSGLKLPDTQKSWFSRSMSLDECRMVCKKNCSCSAYANLDVRDGGSGCLLWFGDLLDVREYKNKLELDIYIRMAASEAVTSLGEGLSAQKNKILLPVMVSSAFTGLVIGLGLIMYILCKNKSNVQDAEGDFRTKIKKEDLDLPLFDFSMIATATNNFSTQNKIGEGGFGPVYKGILEGNQEIAVKRLSKNSNQGLKEFRNEVMCIAKLQHRNLVKLAGCCIQREKILVYEYMPNKSLDFFIFKEMQRKLLNWQKRFHIINGIGRGLLYLHQDSRIRIVHRDLKPSNVLLDHHMNPKISDFGLARSFEGNETEANTKRVIGTYGYMSPEYAIDGIFSTKSDVFSYGVIVLEIVSGKKNRGFNHPDHYQNLLGHAWKLFKEGRSLELIDEFLDNYTSLSEVSRSIHVALLCVQRNPEDRPDMASAILMLGSDSPLLEPEEPGFFSETKVFVKETLTDSELCSNNEVTHTTLSVR